MSTPSLASQPEDTVKVRHSSLGSILLLVVGFAAGLAVGYFSWGTNPIQPTRAAAPAAAPAAAQAPQQPAQVVNVPIGTAPVWGPTEAKITIVEFSDYECPFCVKWHNEVWPQIQQAYPNQVRLVYKDFPLSQIHANASPAALAARCANEQNKYWLFHDRLFSGKPLSTAYYESIATELGMDVAKWRSCVTSSKYNKDIETDYNYGASLGITGTPTFYVNGTIMIGAQPFSAFKKLIDQELAKN
jgi:protein-disulfide isomerase